MSTPIESYFPRIFLLYLKRRTDRTQHARDTLLKIGIDPNSITWIEGPDKPRDHNGQQSGNLGCTMGHRMILERIIGEGIPRALVLEDDVDIAFTDPGQCQVAHYNPARGRRVDPQALFALTVPEIPEGWDMMYLGGHYAETPPLGPRAFVSPHLVRIGRMHTTSSYGITLAMAERMAPSIQGVGPIDTLYSGFLRDANAYCIEPRIFNQMAGYSDLMEEDYNPSHAMQDLNHLKAAREGRTYG